MGPFLPGEALLTEMDLNFPLPDAQSPPKLGLGLPSPMASAYLSWSGGNLPGLAGGQG